MSDIAEGLDWSAETLLADARAQSGLSNFEDDSFLEPMAVLTDSLLSEAGLHPQGALSARARIVDNLVGRLTAQDYFTRYPEILQEEILAPFFIAFALFVLLLLFTLALSIVLQPRHRDVPVELSQGETPWLRRLSLLWSEAGEVSVGAH